MRKDIESPIWDAIEETHKSYDQSLEYLLANSDENSLIFIATHNEKSIEKAMNKMEELGINDSRVRFSQLKGFSDHLADMLIKSNKKVYKYLPFGQYDLMLPYFVKRS